MDTGPICCKAVLHRDPHDVTPAGSKCRPRILAIDRIDRSGHSVQGHSGVLDIKMVFHYPAGIRPCTVVIGSDAETVAPALAGEGSICTLRIRPSGCGR